MPFGKATGVTRLSQLNIDADLDMGAHKILTDRIDEKTLNARVSFPFGLKADILAEYLAAAGITADGVLLKDALMNIKYLDVPLQRYFAVTEKVDIQNTWPQSNTAGQTKYHRAWVSQAAIIQQTASAANNDEFKFANILLKGPATYKITTVSLTGSDSGILEILHGVTSLGTIDQYTGGAVNNAVLSLYATIATTATADLRFKVTGKNGSSTGYWLRFSAIKIEEVLADGT